MIVSLTLSQWLMCFLSCLAQNSRGNFIAVFNLRGAVSAPTPTPLLARGENEFGKGGKSIQTVQLLSGRCLFHQQVAPQGGKSLLSG